MYMRKANLAICLLAFSLSIYAQTDTTTKAVVLTGVSTDRYYVPSNRTFNVYTIGTGYKGPKTSLNGLLNTGQLFKNDTTPVYAVQYELEFYQKLTKTTSYWVNYAYSQSVNFPNHRVLTRIWQQLPANFLVSGGYNYYHTQDNINIHMANFGLERYMGRYWLEGRALIFFKEPDTKYAWQLTSRVFWNDVNYFQLLLMTGAAPDEPWLNDGASSLTAHTIMTSVSSYIGKSHRFQLKAGVGYSYEEYKPDEWRNRYVGNVGLLLYIF